MWQVWKSLLIWILLMGTWIVAQPNSDEKEDWVDPFDMLNFDHTSNTMFKKKDVVESATEKPMSTVGENVAPNNGVSGDSKSSCDRDSQNKLKDCSTQRENIKAQYTRCQEKLDARPPLVVPFLKQYVRQLLGYFNLEIPTGESILYDVIIRLSSEDRFILERFTRVESVSVQDAHAVLSSMIQRVTPRSAPVPENTWSVHFQPWIDAYLPMVLQVLCSVLLIVVIFRLSAGLQFSLFQIGVKFLLFLFFLSFPWNWWHLYMTAVADRHDVILKDMPKECKADASRTHFEAFLQGVTAMFIISGDVCKNYHRAVLADPLWEVPPTKAIAYTVTKFIFEPLEIIGASVRKLFVAALQDLPMTWYPFMWVTIILLIIVVLLMSCGYRLTLPMSLGTIEPSTKSGAIADKKVFESVENNTQQIQSMKQMLEDVLDKVGPAVENLSAIKSSSNHLISEDRYQQNIQYGAVPRQICLPEASLLNQAESVFPHLQRSQSELIASQHPYKYDQEVYERTKQLFYNDLHKNESNFGSLNSIEKSLGSFENERDAVTNDDQSEDSNPKRDSCVNEYAAQFVTAIIKEAVKTRESLDNIENVGQVDPNLSMVSLD